jgi:hypothetical protein
MWFLFKECMKLLRHCYCCSDDDIVQILKPHEASASWRRKMQGATVSEQMKGIFMKFDSLESQQASMHGRLNRVASDVHALVEKLIDAEEPEPEPEPELEYGPMCTVCDVRVRSLLEKAGQRSKVSAECTIQYHAQLDVDSPILEPTALLILAC